MENTTVKELIEILSKLDPDAVVCSFELDYDNSNVFSTFEVCKQFNNVVYINDSGDEVIGNVVAIY